MPASFPQYVTEAITGPLSDPPGVKLRKEGLTAKHPVVFVPGIVTGGLELWEGHNCADGLFRKRLWGGTFGELYKRLVLSWFFYLKQNNEPLFFFFSFLFSVCLSDFFSYFRVCGLWCTLQGVIVMQDIDFFHFMSGMCV